MCADTYRVSQFKRRNSMFFIWLYLFLMSPVLDTWPFAIVTVREVRCTRGGAGRYEWKSILTAHYSTAALLQYKSAPLPGTPLLAKLASIQIQAFISWRKDSILNVVFLRTVANLLELMLAISLL